MSESFDFAKALTRLAASNDLVDATAQYEQFCQLLRRAAEVFEVHCTVTMTAGETRVQVTTPLGTVAGRMTIRITDHPHAAAVFDGTGPEGEVVPLYAVYLSRHEHWSDSRGNTFEQDFASDTYSVRVGRVALNEILHAQMIQLNTDVERYAG